LGIVLEGQARSPAAWVEMKKNWMYKLVQSILQKRCLKLDVKDENITQHQLDDGNMVTSNGNLGFEDGIMAQP